MCPNSCIAYTGPFSELDKCPKCGEARFELRKNKRVPHRKFHTIPLGPQLQALWRTPEGAKAMRYRREYTQNILNQIQTNDGKIPAYDDVFSGKEYIDAVIRGDIQTEDMLLMLSIDGAQLYQSKQSDCWIYLWIVFDLPPDRRYMKRCVLPGGFIGGPNKMKHADSFLYPGVQHVASLQKEGLHIWDALENKTFVSRPIFWFGTADGPGMTYLNGLIGHHGAYGCRLYCPRTP
jgi:hypothetical protein